MGLWIIAGILLFFWVLARADSRNRSNLPTRRWNIWFGPKPKEGEGRARYTLRRALAAAATLVAVSLPLFVVSAPPDEGTSFSGHESTVGFAVFLVCAPLAAMAFFTLFALLFSALVSAFFREDHVFDVDSGDFMRR